MLKKLPKKRTKTTWIVVGSIAAVVIAGSGAGAWYFLQPKSEPVVVKKTPKVTNIVEKAPEQKTYATLSGAEITNAELNQRPVTAIMIENSPAARPQSGLKDAGIVYETVTEAGITRLAAVYQDTTPQLIGPVRSLRPYYIDWIAPYTPSIAHVGGSAEALKEVRNGSYRDIDQFFNARTYWRSTDRYAPHNVYTSFERIDTLNAQRNYTPAEYKAFVRSDDTPLTAPKARTISINVSSNTYDVSYQYDPSSNTYTRSVGGALHADREKGTLAPSVVIAMHVNVTPIPGDSSKRVRIQTSGSGNAAIFQNGDVIECTWRKGNTKDPLEFVDTTGAPIKLARGQTWITATPHSITDGVRWQ